MLARKPLIGTVTANVLAHGTGGLNVDGCRVESGPDYHSPDVTQGVNGARTSWAVAAAPRTFEPASGRWPPNLLLTHAAGCGAECAPGCPVAELDRQSGELASGARGSGVYELMGYGGAEAAPMPAIEANSGGASRFFPVSQWDVVLDVPFVYVPKAARRERDAGLHDLEPATGGEATDREDGSDGLRSPRAGAGRNGGSRNLHPTVKPVELMEWLVRLVTPPGGTVLDPFLGSGSTGCAAVRLGFDFVGVEREAQYLKIAERRIRLAESTPRAKPIGGLDRGEIADPRQVPLFGEPTP